MSNINLSQYKNISSNGDFAVIEEDGVYHARLMMVRISKQDERFVEDGKEPRDQISFLFDVLNSKGLSCHVATKPCTVTFTDRSRLPVILGKLCQPKDGDELKDVLYTKEGQLKDIYCKVMVEVKERPNGDGFYNTVTKIVAVEEPTGQAESNVTEWDFKAYGKAVDMYDLNPKYETNLDDDFFARLRNA